MPAWLLTTLLSAGVLALLFAFGSVELVTVFALMFGWFALLGLLGVALETLVQRARGHWRDQG